MMGTSVTHNVIRFPALLLIFIAVLLQLTAYLIVRVAIAFWESVVSQTIPRHGRLRKILKNQMETAENYEKWKESAIKLDKVEGREKWKKREDGPYAVEVTKRYVEELNESLTKITHHQNDETQEKNRKYQALLETMNNFFATDNPLGIFQTAEMWNKTHIGTKEIIEKKLLPMIEKGIKTIRDAPEKHINEATKMTFFKRAHQTFGKTALYLSGGAYMTLFHIGVIKALHEAKMMPNIVTGSSGGALMAAFICSRTEEERVKEVLTPDSYAFFTACEQPWWKKIYNFLQNGHLFRKEHWIPKMAAVTKGEYVTFLEAYRKSGLVLNISVTASDKHSPPLLCNYATTPHVVVWSAVLASSAFPLILEPVELLFKDPVTLEIKPFLSHGRRWTDGTIMSDIPTEAVQKLFNVRQHCVSQVNPHAFFFFFDVLQIGNPSAQRIGSQKRGGWLLSSLEKILKQHIMTWANVVGELDLLATPYGVNLTRIFSQAMHGNVTIVPRVTWRHYWNILSDPTRSSMADYIRRGEMATWPLLMLIQSRMILERQLSDGYLQLKRKMISAETKSVPQPHIDKSSANGAYSFFKTDNELDIDELSLRAEYSKIASQADNGNFSE